MSSSRVRTEFRSGFFNTATGPTPTGDQDRLSLLHQSEVTR
jgi:hypothetical protein